MPWSPFDILLSLPAFALVLFRLTGLVLAAPVLASRYVPVRIRGALLVVLAAMVYPVVALPEYRQVTLPAALAGAVSEVMIGAAIGLSLSLLLTGAEVVGEVVGQQAGLALGRVFDPTINDETSVVGQIYAVVFTTIFLVAGGHRAAVAAVLDTYEVIPILSYGFESGVVLLLVEMLTAAFVLGIRLAAPVVIALFLTATALGFLSRTMPQLNILTVGFTVRAIVAIAVAAIALASCDDLMLDAIFNALETIRSVFGVDPAATRLVS